jgi:hypothetical protein
MSLCQVQRVSASLEVFATFDKFLPVFAMLQRFLSVFAKKLSKNYFCQDSFYHLKKKYVVTSGKKHSTPDQTSQQHGTVIVDRPIEILTTLGLSSLMSTVLFKFSPVWDCHCLRRETHITTLGCQVFAMLGRFLPRSFSENVFLPQQQNIPTLVKILNSLGLSSSTDP